MSKEPKNKYQEALKQLSPEHRVSLHKIFADTQGDNNRITDADVDQIMGSIATKYKGLTSEQLSVIKAKLQGMVHTGASNLGELMTKAEEEASGCARDNAQQQNQTPEHQIAHLWADTKEKEKDIAAQMRQAHEHGDITDESYNEWLKSYDMAQALPDSSPQKVNLTAQAAALAEHALKKAADKADDEGRDAQADRYHKGAGSAYKVEENMKALHKLHADGQKEEKMETAGTQKKAMRFSDNDDPVAATPPKGKQGMEVADVTLSDVQAPAGVKERSFGRAATTASKANY